MTEGPRTKQLQLQLHLQSSHVIPKETASWMRWNARKRGHSTGDEYVPATRTENVILEPLYWWWRCLAQYTIDGHVLPTKCLRCEVCRSIWVSPIKICLPLKYIGAICNKKYYCCPLCCTGLLFFYPSGLVRWENNEGPRWGHKYFHHTRHFLTTERNKIVKIEG